MREATNPSHAEAADKTKGRPVSDDGDRRRDSAKGVFRKEAPDGGHRLTLWKLPNIRLYAQELRNRFANLLNRGSSLE
jgi:hypothetical protein